MQKEKKVMFTKNKMVVRFVREYYNISKYDNTSVAEFTINEWDTAKEEFNILKHINGREVKLRKVCDVILGERIVTIESEKLFDSKDFILYNFIMFDKNVIKVISPRGKELFNVLKENQLNINQIKQIVIQ